MLRVEPSGYKQWIQQLFIHGKRRELGLGPVRLVTLAEARDAAQGNRKLARAGGDPMATQRTSVPTFEQAAGKVLAMHRPAWKSAKHAGQWAATLRNVCISEDRTEAGGLDHDGRCHGGVAADLEREAPRRPSGCGNGSRR